MVEAGLTPGQAIEAATSRPADLLDLDDVGLLTAGRRADFIVLTRISDLAVVPYRQASRRALISGAPTQGTPPRRVTPCG